MTKQELDKIRNAKTQKEADKAYLAIQNSAYKKYKAIRDPAREVYKAIATSAFKALRDWKIDKDKENYSKMNKKISL